jgi:hypothetical protein
MRFFGRKNELDSLERLLIKKTASLVVVWGRRRIGKSTLISKFLDGKKSWNFSGFPPNELKTHQDEINYFVRDMARNIGMPELKTSDWGEVFWHLGNQAEKESKIIIFFDEISWMGSKDSNFLGYLKTEWDKTFSKHPNLILILCGSVSTWIEENILNSTGFFGRISLKLNLKELSLAECNQFWNTNHDRISAYEKLKILGVTGGVPKYLDEIIPTESAEKNINHLCFREEGLLYREYHQIFSDLFFRRASTFDKLIRVLSDGAKNLDEICLALKMDKSGNTSKYLHELIAAGFVSEDRTWDIKSKKESNLKLFRLKDNYIRFYLKFIEPNTSKIQKNGFSSVLITTLPGWEAIMGLQFENLVINNIKHLCEILGISLQDVEKSGPFFQKKSTKNKGCQIDLLIQTKFGTLYLCEIKFYLAEVGKQVISEVEEKINRLTYPKGYSIRPVLIHVNGVTHGVIESGYFDKVIDFSEFLKS